MIRNLEGFADTAQRLIARSGLGVRFAVALRNQCRCIIKYHLAESPNAQETGERWLLEHVASYGDRFIDVGANVGDWLALLVGARGDRAFGALAFEPSQAAFELLKRQYGADDRITIFDCAMGNEHGSLSFFEEASAGKGSTFVPDFLRSDGVMTVVDVRRLEDILIERGWDRVDLLKVDAEGYDLQVLRGAGRFISERCIDIIQFEYNRSWQLACDTLRGAYRLLESNGYRVFVLKREGLYSLNYHRYEEYYEYTNFVAIAPQALPRFAGQILGDV